MIPSFLGGIALSTCFVLPLALLMACTSDADTPLASEPTAAAAPALINTPAAIPSTLAVAIDDLEQRILPALDDEAALALGGALRSLREAATQGDPHAIRAASAQLHTTAVALSRHGHSALAVDLSVIDLVMAAIDAELMPPMRAVR
jgi:hypothetical protein